MWKCITSSLYKSKTSPQSTETNRLSNHVSVARSELSQNLPVFVAIYVATNNVEDN